ncbi:MAG: hypothetical protein FJY80_08680 [Candidatus Aminicenantes bacterium]|nr:hypothetical protein [Candidatus Aminicenantes bacterium]
MRKPFLTGLGLAAALAAATVCKTASSSGPSDTPKDDPSFTADIQAIFTSSCALSSCHSGGAPAGGLSLAAGQSYASLVNVASSGEPNRIRVIPNDATNSYLVVKLEGRQTIGTKMPQGGSLSATALQNIKNWINKGAKNN